MVFPEKRLQCVSARVLNVLESRPAAKKVAEQDGVLRLEPLNEL